MSLKPIGALVEEWWARTGAARSNDWNAANQRCADELEALLQALQERYPNLPEWIQLEILGVPKKESSDGR